MFVVKPALFIGWAICVSFVSQCCLAQSGTEVEPNQIVQTAAKEASPSDPSTVDGVDRPAGDAEALEEPLPSAKRILKKYVKAMGGYEVLGSVQSAHYVMKGTSNSGYELECEQYQIKGSYHCRYLNDGMNITRGVWADGTLNKEGVRTGFAWQQIDGFDMTEMVGEELQEYLRRRTRVMSSPFWEDDFKTIKCIAKTEIRGIPAYQLRFTDHNEREIDRFFDIRTGYLLRRKAIEAFNGRQQEVTREYMDHQKLEGGFVIARKQSISHNDRVDQWEIVTAEFDIEIPDGIFEVPDSIQNRIFALQQRREAEKAELEENKSENAPSQSKSDQ